jgi:hypothetical protein
MYPLRETQFIAGVDHVDTHCDKIKCIYYCYGYLNISGVRMKWSAPLLSEPSIVYDSKTFQINSYLTAYFPKIHFSVILDHFLHTLNQLYSLSIGIPNCALELYSFLYNGYAEL